MRRYVTPGVKSVNIEFVCTLTQLEGVCDFGSLKKTRLFPTKTTQDGLQFFLQPNRNTSPVSIQP